ncbi:glycosyltransferase family 1 protein [Corallococcus sp. AB011P]|uniref:glycosyltransferase n=1 Tax=unclassified Corallococcus TaxID=2685029 RepID=UPI000EA3162C|nr:MULTISPECIES: glycosyltransferase [unclassified Corallococcus]RKG52250.1 glycosyltransferase family 1 protein [Corallococcus sp. AB011P]RKH75796.1 glycosyltransferase family 1 protein [Corallococcus sp. AB045]
MTQQRVNLFTESEPFKTAGGVINGLILEDLKEQGHEVNTHFKHRLGPADTPMPVATADRLRRILAEPPADLAIYCDMGLWIHPPSPRIARRSVVLFHGLVGGQSLWLGNPAVDLYTAYSPYMREALISLLTLPDVRRRTCLDPSGFDKVVDFHAGLPCVASATGDSRMQGAQLPPQVQEALDAGDVLGHALQPRKPDWYAVLNILLHLNLQSREANGPRYRLIVDAEDFALIDYSYTHGFPFDVSSARSMLDAMGFKISDLLIPVRFLNQAALFRLFELAKFGLSFNIYPEPFGFYPLESVYQGCPVYTNGIGNNRFSVPPGHGIRVFDNVDMAFGDPFSFQEVANAILEDVRSRERVTQECARGRDFITRNFDRASFTRTWRKALEHLDAPRPAPRPFESLVVKQSPMVRRLEEETGRVVSDFERQTLEPRELAILKASLDRAMGQVLSDMNEADQALLQGLFSRGVLTLRPEGHVSGL